MTRVKICGLTDLGDALHCARCGADAIGFNFYEGSPRYISPANARQIGQSLRAEPVKKIGVFVNGSIEYILETALAARLDAIQLHGDEPPAMVSELRFLTTRPVIKALRVGPDFDEKVLLKYQVDAILLDGYLPGQPGGTGRTIDRRIARRCVEITPRVYLAGGLSVHNVSEAIAAVRPFAVDACSGLESEPGKKDPEKVEEFIARVRGTV